MKRHPSEDRSVLAAHLSARRSEIEEAVLTRIYAIGDPTEVSDSAYADGLQATVAAALDYGLGGLERGDERAPRIPSLLLVQARVAARSGTSLDTVLRRYFAGYSLLGDFLVEEVERNALMRGSALKRLLGSQATLFDRLLAAVSEEYSREAKGWPQTAERRRRARVEKLLEGELLDTSEFGYDFDAYHLGAIVASADGEDAARELAGDLDCRPLILRSTDGVVWIWFGAQRRIDSADLERRVVRDRRDHLAMAIGEPAKGLAGWRFTHRQARAAFSIAQRGPTNVVRYVDVALVASALRDDVCIFSLQKLYLVPLQGGRDNGRAARETLRAYFAADRNLSSAAAFLGVNRNTVTSRLRDIEDRIGRPVHLCSAELEIALRLDDLDAAEFPTTR